MQVRLEGTSQLVGSLPMPRALRDGDTWVWNVCRPNGFPATFQMRVREYVLYASGRRGLAFCCRREDVELVSRFPGFEERRHEEV
jgi:hypothetical protein